MKEKDSHSKDNQVLSETQTTEDKAMLDFAIELQAKYDTEEAEREFMEDVGDLSRLELLDVLREERSANERLYKSLFNEKNTHDETKKTLIKFKADQKLSAIKRLIAREENKSLKAKDREDSKAFGVSDFYSLVRDSIKKFDDLNNRLGVVKRDNVKEIRGIMIDLIIAEKRSSLELNREELERLAKKYLNSGTVRTARKKREN